MRIAAASWTPGTGICASWEGRWLDVARDPCLVVEFDIQPSRYPQFRLDLVYATCTHQLVPN